MAEGKAKQAPKKPAAKKAPAAGAAPAEPGETCSLEKCKQPVRAKGLCRKHYIAWRRGTVGAKHRYKTCSKEGCRKPATASGKCEEHGKGKQGEASAAAA